MDQALVSNPTPNNPSGIPGGTPPFVEPKAVPGDQNVFKRITDVVSQQATKLNTVADVKAFIAQNPQIGTLPPPQQAELAKVYTNTRQTQGLPIDPQLSAAFGGGPQQGALTTPPPPANGQAAPQQQGAQGWTAPLNEQPANFDISGIPKPGPYTPPQFQQPQYHPPKGLGQYLGLAASLLFPGAPISYAGSGFLRGSQAGAENRYQREEEAAKNTYQSKLAQAQAAHQNQLEQYNESIQDVTARANTQKQVNERAEQLRKQGVDPLTGKQFPYAVPPTPNLSAMRTKSGQTDFAARQAAAMTTAKAYQSLLMQAEKNGDDTNSKLFAAQYQSWSNKADDEERNKNAWDLALQQEAAANKRTEMTISAEDRRSERTEAAATYRAELEYGAARTKSMTDFHTGIARYGTELRTMMYPTTPGAPAPLAPGTALGGLYQNAAQQVSRSSDPQATAEHFATLIKDPAAAQLLQEYGSLMYMDHMNRGVPFKEMNYDQNPKLQKAHDDNILRRAGLNPDDKLVQEARTQITNAGFSLDEPGAVSAIVAQVRQHAPTTTTNAAPSVPASQFPSGRAPAAAPAPQFKEGNFPHAQLNANPLTPDQQSAAPQLATMLRMPYAQRAAYIAAQPKNIKDYLASHQYDPVSLR